ncbi:bifunctional diaminohydroxyphosphoribosylaminopyrimidine deaminase/5-amino-6-(5-phosphoribosylamino)uracil reductase RibD [Clostridium sp. JS66]|uniref:bifunctional diaminohydroxyphosphoribosylaminopyrimidine deaminase/5-amino-6-(5-phosphoribosylamino)uracil reductase RibD n=1 Tax=Clostridium sp. JS66 TaxID=3064705 RepID=UPI00298D710F|nr:bifunctional diaminohydroxyphosphoribosylaminopyrimidine deaminase/5-amino-6-(5-phosphoribosylamino)uracil reductase RibD [Clostridium sp. JS66]WPC42591.1 bifunctional diaminohydroxyphosphoribosylaminopyrimidine deaminase/5-amino-6-(5-phosphoribosylamino)uracil reductase RibD [Clostridium sp. JS66]
MNDKKKNLDEYYMKMALNLALKGQGNVNPNPLVGAVIVNNGNIVGQGYHKFYGGPHAEVYALKEAGEMAKGGELYVSLEPCSHYGKTPPCAEAVLKAGIKKVVIAMKDPNSLVAGRGIELLEKNGVEVVVGVLEEEAKKVNEIFIKYITQKTPFVILKTAMTLDGKIATRTGESQWITGEESRKYVHIIRNRVMGIMAGIGTIKKDDPLLTTRFIEDGKSPTAIIVDSKLSIPVQSKIFTTLDKRKIIIACTEEFDAKKKEELEQKGIKIIVTPKDNNRVDLKYLMKELGKEGIDSILLEGGGELNFSALDSKIVDKILCFIAPKILGGATAKTPVEGNGIEILKNAVLINKMNCKNVGEDLLIEGYFNN